MKKDHTQINITLPPEIISKIKENNLHRNNLIISLLKKYLTTTNK